MSERANERVVVFGSVGQVASALKARLPGAVFVPGAEADFRRPDGLAPLLDRLDPALVINPAAYTQVDQAEADAATAMLVNAEAPAEIARWCATRGRSLIHFSTDYVYPGRGEDFVSETEEPGPLNIYGGSKLLGDESVRGAGGHHVILRTSWLYQACGKNFLTTMLKLGAEREALAVVGDQFGAPTYVPDLAEAAVAVAFHPVFQDTSGVFHCVNAGVTTWHGFAREIFGRAARRGVVLRVRDVQAISSEEYKAPAQRPRNSRLSCDKLQRTFGITLRDWTEALEDALSVVVSAKPNNL